MMFDIFENYNNRKLYTPLYIDFRNMLDLSRKTIVGDCVFCHIDSKLSKRNYGVDLMRFSIFDYSHNCMNLHYTYLEGSTDMMELVYALHKLHISNFIINFTSLGDAVWRSEYLELLESSCGIFLDDKMTLDISSKFIKN